MGSSTLYASYNPSCGNQGTFLDDFSIRWPTVFWVFSSLKALALFQVQRARKLHHVLVTTKMLPRHRLIATSTMTLQLKTIVKVAWPTTPHQVVLLSQIDQEAFCLP
jgi:hypothetical protein